MSTSIKNLKEGMLIRFAEDMANFNKRSWILLYVTKHEIDNTGIDADKEGFYAFGGFWYGSDPFDKKNYGKMVSIESEENIVVIYSFTDKKDFSLLLKLLV